MRRLLVVVAAALALATLALPARATTAPATAAAVNACATPEIVKALYAVADQTKTRKIGDGRIAVSFHLPAATTLPGSVLDIAHPPIAETPHYSWGGQDWFLRADTWIEWFESDPCSGQDGYAYGFNVVCYRAAIGSNSPRTAVSCNWDVRAALQFDHNAHDWDAVWGYKKYGDNAETACADTGGFHYFPDTSPGELRTLIIARARFLTNDHVTQWRKTASLHLWITGKGTHSAPGSGEWVDVATIPDGGLGNC